MLARIHPGRWEELGWPELVGNELAVAPEFGHRRVRRCGARGGELVGAACSWGCAECAKALGRGRQQLWP